MRKPGRRTHYADETVTAIFRRKLEKSNSRMCWNYLTFCNLDSDSVFVAVYYTSNSRRLFSNWRQKRMIRFIRATIHAWLCLLTVTVHSYWMLSLWLFFFPSLRLVYGFYSLQIRYKYKSMTNHLKISIIDIVFALIQIQNIVMADSQAHAHTYTNTHKWSQNRRKNITFL